MIKSALGFARPVARRLKRLARAGLDRLRPVVMSQPLPPAACRAAVTVRDRFATLEKGESVTYSVAVRNTGPRPFSSRGPHAVTLSYRWLCQTGEPLNARGERTALPVDLKPGCECVVTAAVKAPGALGDYTLEFDLLQDGDGWFKDHGSPPAKVPVLVTGKQTQEIDYHRVYECADLARDYWTVVGPSTEAEFHRLAKVKLDLLVGLGLNPDGRVLDVGCGTGLLTQALDGYLSEAGLYYGTDIGKEGVLFCRRRFKRPNFHFLQSGMTTVPVRGVQFDFIVFFSVFTHTYPDETTLLLAEARRLLAPGGVIYADLFTSPMVTRSAGNRGAVEVNEEHMLRLIDAVGLKASEHMSGAWEQFGRRLFLTMTAK